MSNKKQNEELQSRREFFKKAAKAALPVVGAVVLSSIPFTKAEAATTGCGYGCSNGCYQSCLTTCHSGCKGSCSNYCGQTCGNSCSGTCQHHCTAMQAGY